MSSSKTPETILVTEWRVSCDGSGGALGHPRVYLSIPVETGYAICGYCDRRFEIDRAKAQAGH